MHTCVAEWYDGYSLLSVITLFLAVKLSDNSSRRVEIAVILFLRRGVKDTFKKASRPIRDW